MPKPKRKRLVPWELEEEALKGWIAREGEDGGRPEGARPLLQEEEVNLADEEEEGGEEENGFLGRA